MHSPGKSQSGQHKGAARQSKFETSRRTPQNGMVNPLTWEAMKGPKPLMAWMVNTFRTSQCCFSKEPNEWLCQMGLNMFKLLNERLGFPCCLA